MDFNLFNQNNESVSLEDYKGKKVILFFYPKANSSGCANEVNGFSELYQEFKSLNVEVVGISKDSIKKQFNFSKKLNVPFNLLSDENSNLCETFGVWQLKSMCGKEYMGIVRSTFLIDENSQIEKEWLKVKSKGHPIEVLEYLKNKRA